MTCTSNIDCPEGMICFEEEGECYPSPDMTVDYNASEILTDCGKETNEYVRWRIYGKPSMTTVILDSGITGGTFTVKLDTDWFVPGDIIAPTINKHEQFIVRTSPIPTVNGFIYDITQLNNYPTPQEILQPYFSMGNTLTKLGTLYDESKPCGNTYTYQARDLPTIIR